MPARWPRLAFAVLAAVVALCGMRALPAGAAQAPVEDQPPIVRAIVLTAHTTEPGDARVPAGLARAVDDDGTAVPVDCTPAVGTPLDVGDTPVACTATDRAGNVGYATWDLTLVVDPPGRPAAAPPTPIAHRGAAEPGVIQQARLTPAAASDAVDRGAGLHGPTRIPLTGPLAVATGLAVLGVVVLLAGATGLGSMPRP